MKRTALVFIFMILTAQFPHLHLPSHVTQTLEYGREWTGMLLRAFSSTEPVHADIASPQLDGEGSAVSDISEMEMPEPADLPVELASLAPSTHAGQQNDVSVEIQKEINCAVQEFRTKMIEIAKQQRDLNGRPAKQPRKLPRFRSFFPLKSA